MDRYAGGEDAAFAEVYDAVAPRLMGYLRRKVRDPQRAEDLAQQTFMQMHRARGTFIAGSAVLPWAFAIARRLVIDEVRRSRRSVVDQTNDDCEELSAPLGSTGDRVAEARETARALQLELVKLPETQRAAFELLRIDGLSHVEAAAVIGTTVSAVKLRAHRAYEALRRAVERLSEEADEA
jgi:RNA polymerase sigma-70 factor (ECF subfamily)